MRAVWIFLAAAAAWLPPGPTTAFAQDIAVGQDRGLVSAALQMRKLDGVKRVLMIAAHPDDEDSGLLAAMARGMGIETAYLSLTRGEGGQNLIGPRLHEGLGVIRTGELVAARNLDGGAQYFTRAFDFGFSKSLDEALRMWPLEEVVRDIVHVMRDFRPHVVVSVFSGTPRDGHGQHQYAGVATREAFEAAGDPERYPELAARGLDPWRPAKLYRSTRFAPRDATLIIPTGDFDLLLGRSHHQLAMESRSLHRSQDMGSGQTPGPRASSLRLVAVASGDGGANGGGVTGSDQIGRDQGVGVDLDAEDAGLFAGVDTTLLGQLGTPTPPGWPADTEQRIERYRDAIADAGRNLSAMRPDGAVRGLGQAASTLRGLLDDATVDGADQGRRLIEHRLAKVSAALMAAAGVVVEAKVARDLLTPGESVVVDVNVWNGGPLEITRITPRLVLGDGWIATPTDQSTLPPSRSPFLRVSAPSTPEDGRLGPGEIGRWSWSVAVPPDAKPSTPYYLSDDLDGAMYRWPDDDDSWTLPFDSPPVRATVGMVPAGGVRVTARREAVYVGVDKAAGEYRERVHVAPAIDVAASPPWMVWPQSQDASIERIVQVGLTNRSATPRTGLVGLDAPPGWRVEPPSAHFALEPDGASTSFTFSVVPPTGTAQEEGTLFFRAFAREHSQATEHRTELDIVDHPHIERAMLAREATVRVSIVGVTADADLQVGYVTGSGDDGATVLRQMGMQVEELDEDRVRAGDFAGLDVVVLGVRAYETRPDLIAANDAVLDFARAGGTVVVQYNKYEFPAGDFAPYPVAMSRPHDRVTDETAPVTILAPESPVFTTPNRIGHDDFEGWVQERGLYYLGEWDDRYTPVMEMADPDEDPKRGALVVAEVGEGLYVYTGLAFFRQFPAGVPGAYRLFANLASLRAEAWRRRTPVSQQ